MQLTALIAEAAAEGEHNILLPALPDLIWGGVSFVLLFLLFWKFVLPVANKLAAERAEKIEGGLLRAEKAQDEAARLLAEYKQALAEARTEAAAIRNAAQADRASIVNEARDEAIAAASEIMTRANEQVALERDQVVAGLQREVGQLAVELAGRIVGEVLTDDARAKAAVDRFIADLERAASEAGR